MYHFIPAWYQKDRKWYDDTKEWTHVDQFLQFDDAVNQIRIFKDNQEELEVYVLNYAPHLRTFLHQKDLLEVTVWSLFDELQGRTQTQASSLNWRHLNWPKGVSFLYSPFTVTALLDDILFARIQFTTDGRVFQILLYDNDSSALKESLVFDDRGFLSSIQYFEQGQLRRQDYLDEEGIWRLREHLNQNRGFVIEVNIEKLPFLKQATYANWETLIQEILISKFSNIPANDVLVISADDQHNHFFKEVPAQKVYSFFQDRLPITGGFADNMSFLEGADLLVSDSQKNTEALKSLDSVETLPAIIQVSPFDTRFELGLSIRRKELEIYFFADQLSDDDIKSSLKIIFKEMAKNPLITLTVGTYQKFGPRLQWLESLIGDYSDKHIPVEKVSIEDLLPDKNTEEEEPRAKVLVLKAENDVISQFKTSRLVIDLGMQPDLYHQIAAISSGIPQINQVQSDYVTHQQNGYIISQLSDLPKGIDYFFKGLANWNKSLVYSIEKIADNTGSALISKWQSHLKGQDNNE